MNHKIIMLIKEGRGKKGPYCLIHLHKMLENANYFAVTENRTVVLGVWRGERER